MVAIKATKESVKDAYDKLKQDGIKPSVNKILSKTGGSKATVLKYLHEINIEETQGRIALEDIAEEELVDKQARELVHAVFAACKTRADNIAIKQYESLAKIDESMSLECKRFDDLEAIFKAKEDAFKAAQEKDSAEISFLKTELESAKKNIDDLRALVEELKSKQNN